jgi:hypothetical protein
MSRPQTLAQAAAAALFRDKTFGSAVDELLDEFYLDQQARIDEPPGTRSRTRGLGPSGSISPGAGDSRCRPGPAGRNTPARSTELTI